MTSVVNFPVVLPAHSAPLFATVTFLRDDTEQNTFRVPIAADTTVSALARSSMSRLHTQTKVAYGIREVFVALSLGDAASSKVNLFVHDIVTNVVNVKEERIFLVLKRKDEVHPQPPQMPISSGAISSVPARSREERSPSPHINAESLAFIKVKAMARRSKSPAVERTVSDGSDITTAHSTTTCSSNHTANTHNGKAAAVAQSAKDEMPKKRSPAKRLREDEVSTPEIVKVQPVTKMSEVEKKKYIESKRQEGWGKEAHKNFESNYVSDPEKLARELRRQKKEATATVSTSCAAATAATRQQQKDVDKTQPRTVAMRSPSNDSALNRQLFVEIEDEEIGADRPQGWGVKAKKYFDMTTYHDDPSKAKLPPEVLNQPIRARRHVNVV